MLEYRELRTGAIVKAETGKFHFPTTGANLLVKPRPPIAKEMSTD